MTDLIFGERGEGKSTLAMYLAEKESTVTLLFEPKPDDTTEGKGMYVFDETEMYEAMQQAMSVGEGRIIYVPGDDIDDGFAQFCDVLKSPNPAVPYSFGGFSVIIDESWALMSANKSHSDLERLVRLAPRSGQYRIGVKILGHKPTDINQRTHFFSDRIFCFRIVEVADLETLTKRWSPALAETVSSFPEGQHFVAMYDKNTRMLEVWDDPAIWYL